MMSMHCCCPSTIAVGINVKSEMKNKEVEECIKKRMLSKNKEDKA